MQTQPATSSRQDSPVVLIIEDDPATAELYSILFDKSGLQSVVAHDSSTAHDYLRSTHPDALVLDIMMPDESGLDLCRSLRSSPHYSNVPVIMVSALAESKDVQAGLEAGASAYLTKPVSPGTLTETVRKWIVPSSHIPESTMVRLEVEVQRTVMEVKRRVAEIARAHRVFDSYTRELQQVGEAPSATDPAKVRRALEVYRSRIVQSEAAGWRVLESTLRRVEQLEIALRRRGVHEPKDKAQWELARARRPFVREDCWQWASSCPDHILTEYAGAVQNGDNIYAYLLERYGQWALEEAKEWDQLAELRRRILAATRSNSEELGAVERLYAQLTPLMSQLSEQRIPDEVVFVHPPVQQPEAEVIPPVEWRSDPPPD